MTAAEYAAQVIATTALFVGKLQTALAPDCAVIRRYKRTKTTADDGWLAAIKNDEGTIRMCSIRMFSLGTSDDAATAGGHVFKPRVRLGIEIFQDYRFGTDLDNTQEKFDGDVLKIQYAIEANKNLSPAYIESYSLNLGFITTKTEMIHYGEGEVVLMFRNLRYET